MYKALTLLTYPDVQAIGKHIIYTMTLLVYNSSLENEDCGWVKLAHINIIMSTSVSFHHSFFSPGGHLWEDRQWKVLAVSGLFQYGGHF